MQFLSGGINDALVGLMRDEPGNVVGRGAGGLERIDDDVGDHAHRMFEHFAAFHAKMSHRLGRGRTAVDIQLGFVPAVGAQVRGQHTGIRHGAGLLLRVQHDGAGAVAEQHAGGAIVPVENAREGFRADHQRALEGSAAQEIIRGRNREHKARAHRLKVERRAVMNAERVLDCNRGGGKRVVRRRGRTHDQVDRLRIDPGMFQRRQRRLGPQMRGEFAGCRDMALPDAGALHDPFVRSVDLCRQLRIGQNLLRQIGPTAEHDRTRHSHERAS